ncbi:MAG: DUF4349 domain-containing protein [Planctomycetota bacterium]
MARQGDLTLRVDDVGDFIAEASALAVRMDGYVVKSSHRPREGRRDTRRIALAVRADRFGDAVSELRQLAEGVEAESLSAEDVADVVVDVEARLTNLRSAEERLRGLRSEVKADDGSPDAILAVFRELTDLRGQIERTEAQQRSLRQRVGFATLDVDVLGPEAPGTAVADPDMGPAAMWDYAVSTLVSSLRWLFNAAIFLGVVALPLAAIVVVPIAAVAWLAKRMGGGWQKATVTAAP